MERRTFLRMSVLAAGTVAFAGSLLRSAWAGPAQPGASPYGPLRPADANRIRLPSGFTSQIVARSGEVVSGTSYTCHDAPDGGACFTDRSGWIYVSKEITGPAFSPAGDRLYFSSQRGTGGSSSDGITFCVTGPFRT